jgi:hypothetical protein
MTFINQAQRSSVTAVAAMSAIAAISVSALAAGPLSSNAAWQLAASSVPAEISSAIHDVLVAAHTAVKADRGDIAAEHQAIRTTRRESVQAIGASVLTGAVGDGQIAAIVDAARGANQGARQAISTSHADIHQTRQSAAADIRTIIADGRDGSTAITAQAVTTDNHDGSTVQDVKAIVDTAKKDNAMTRSAIVADALENKSIRRKAATDAAAIRKSARAGDISKQEAAGQIKAERGSARTEIADNHTQMVDSHKQIKATRQQAAQDVAKTVHQGRTGS